MTSSRILFLQQQDTAFTSLLSFFARRRQPLAGLNLKAGLRPFHAILDATLVRGRRGERERESERVLYRPVYALSGTHTYSLAVIFWMMKKKNCSAAAPMFGLFRQFCLLDRLEHLRHGARSVTLWPSVRYSAWSQSRKDHHAKEHTRQTEGNRTHLFLRRLLSKTTQTFDSWNDKYSEVEFLN